MKLQEFIGTLIESNGRVRARLIKEGVSKNGNRWTRKVLESLVKLVDGVPVHFYDMSESGDGSLLNHWQALRGKMPPGIQALLPERLQEAQIGTVRNPQLVVGTDGVAHIESDIEVPDRAGWFRSLLSRVKNVGRELGLSIHVPEDGVKATPISEGGVEPTEVTRVVGFDVVTFPSAGGAFEAVLEALQEDRQMKELWKKLLRHLPKEKRSVLESAAKKPDDSIVSVSALIEGFPDLVTAYLEAAGIKCEAAQRASVLEALYATAPIESTPPTPPAPTPPTPPAPPAPDAGIRESVNGLSESVKKLLKANGHSAIAGALKDSGLPKGLEEFARAQLTGILESQGAIDAEACTAYVASLKKGVGDSQVGGGGMLESADRNSIALSFPQYSKVDDFLAATDAMLEGKPFGEVFDQDGKLVRRVPAFTSVKQHYQVATGDVLMQGLDFYRNNRRIRGVMESMDLKAIDMFERFIAARGGMGVMEALTTASYPLILSDRAHKLVAKEWLSQAMQWKLVARSETVTDFKSWRIQKMGEFPNLAVVAEDAAYVEVTDYPNEEEVTLAIVKHGGIGFWTWEMIVNDDTARLRRFPQKMARAADRTLNTAVWTLVLGNAAIYDTVAFFHATHNNLIAASAISLANLKLMRRKMILQKDLDTREAARVRPAIVTVGPTLYDTAYELIYSDRKPSLFSTGTDTNQAAGTARTITSTRDAEATPNILRGDYGLQLHEVPVYEDIDADAYHMFGDPNMHELIVAGFLNGKEAPELFVQDLALVGSFFDRERITTKIRHIWDVKVSDFRAAQAGIP